MQVTMNVVGVITMVVPISASRPAASLADVRVRPWEVWFCLVMAKTASV